MNEEHKEQQDEQPISEISEPLPEIEPVANSEIPSNLDLGDGYHSLDAPTIEAPPIEDRTTTDIGGLIGRIKDKVDTRNGTPRVKVKVTKAKQKEFMELSRMVLSPLLILAVSKNLGDICKPTKEETDDFVEPAARMIARHVPIPDHMSADLIDMLSMGGVAVVWYTRVSDDLPWNTDDGSGGSDEEPPKHKPPDSDNEKEPITLTEEEITRSEEVLSTLDIDEFKS